MANNGLVKAVISIMVALAIAAIGAMAGFMFKGTSELAVTESKIEKHDEEIKEGKSERRTLMKNQVEISTSMKHMQAAHNDNIQSILRDIDKVDKDLQRHKSSRRAHR